MARQWVTDELWNEVQPLLPKQPPKPKGGRPRNDDRKSLVGIIFVLRTGCAWEDLPAELGCGSSTTCWRRFDEWSKAGVWKAVWQRILNAMGGAGHVDLSRAVVDSASVRAVFGGPTPGRTRLTAPNQAANAT